MGGVQRPLLKRQAAAPIERTGGVFNSLYVLIGESQENSFGVRPIWRMFLASMAYDSYVRRSRNCRQPCHRRNAATMEYP